MTSMLEYIRKVKRALRDQHNGRVTGGDEHDPLIDIPPGTYPCEIDGKVDYVVITPDDTIDCCNWTAPSMSDQTPRAATAKEIIDEIIRIAREQAGENEDRYPGLMMQATLTAMVCVLVQIRDELHLINSLVEEEEPDVEETTDPH